MVVRIKCSCLNKVSGGGENQVPKAGLRLSTHTTGSSVDVVVVAATSDYRLGPSD